MKEEAADERDGFGAAGGDAGVAVDVADAAAGEFELAAAAYGILAKSGGQPGAVVVKRHGSIIVARRT
jgi:hypothetical protein